MQQLVVADDLTGANDTGTAFAERGYETSIRRLTDGTVKWSTDIAVGVVDTDSRYCSATEAARRVSAAIDATATETVYKKIDSTLRGNVTAEIDAALAATDAAFAVVAPAFPATGRVTAGGYHLVNGTPVAETAAGADPDAPVETSFLPDRLDGSTHPVERCPLETISDPAALQARFERFTTSDQTPLVVCDATTTRHLDAIGRSIASISAPVVAVGSGGLAAHLRLGPPADVLGIVGSVAPETFEQLDAMPDDSVVVLDPERAVADTETAVDAAVAAVHDRLAGAETAVVTAARSSGDVDRALAAGRAAGLSDVATKERVRDALASVGATVADERILDGMFTSGGAVAGATLDALDGAGIELTGQVVEAGVPLGRVENGPADGLPFVTKAGGFGTGKAIDKALHALARYNE